MAGTAAVGAGLTGCAPGSSAQAETEQTAGTAAQAATGSDAVLQTDANGNSVYYSMRRSWVGEAPEIAESDLADAYEADVVIVGAGYAGSQCFRMACEQGLTCIVLDTQQKDAFETYGGQLGHFNSTWQEEVLGVPKSTFDPVDFIDSYQLQSAGRANPDLIKQFAHRNGELVDWMMELQPDLSAVTGVNGLVDDGSYQYKKGYFWTYPAVINLGSGAFETSGAFCTASVDAGLKASSGSQAFYGYSARTLVKENGAVTGVIAQDDASETMYRFNAKIGVVETLLQRGVRRAVRRRGAIRAPAHRQLDHPGVGRRALARVRPGPGARALQRERHQRCRLGRHRHDAAIGRRRGRRGRERQPVGGRHA